MTTPAPPGGGAIKRVGASERPAIRRFYKAVTVEERAPHYAVLLDGRVPRTPSKAALFLPTLPLAEAVAAEWTAQAETIEPLTMPLTRLANTALDRVKGREVEIVGEMVSYAGSDLLCYRAEPPDHDLIRTQALEWDPLLRWCGERIGAPLSVASGVMPRPQAPEALEAVRAALAAFDAFALTALHNMTTLTGSAVLALAHAMGRLAPEDAWRLAHLDEDHQIAKWGTDAEAAARREARWREFEASGRLLVLAHGRDGRGPA